MTGMNAGAPADFCVQELSLSQIRALYRERLTEDFPPDELKPLSRIERALAVGHYVCYGAMCGDEMLAYAFFVKQGRCALVDYYAVMREARNRGIGGRFLQALIRGELRDRECVLLEVEDPERAKDLAEQEIRRRRMAFYLRNGLQETGVRASVFGVEYIILSLPVGNAVEARDVRQVYGALYRAMLPKKLYDAMVKL